MIARIDEWMGLRVFQPPAILLCWLMRCTQWRLYRDMWFMFALWIFYRASVRGDGWISLVFIGVFCIIKMLLAMFASPHRPTASPRWIRIVWLIFLVTDIGGAIISGDQLYRPFQDIWALIAEYAATITNLPPPPTFRVRRMKMEKQRVRVS